MSPLAALGWREHLHSVPAHRDTWAQGIRRLSSMEAPTLRRCPICIAQDRARYGCAHWRVFHQWPVARHCAVHGVPLETHCMRCQMPFMRRHEPSLADDPCPVCGSDRGAADPTESPAGYWPLLRNMYELLTGSAEPVSELARASALWRVEPGQVGSKRKAPGLRAAVDRLLEQWSVTSMEQLAAMLGVNWIWFNEAERSGHMKELPPLMSLALVSTDLLPVSATSRNTDASRRSIERETPFASLQI